MANSSEWITALQSQPAEGPSDALPWFEALQEPAGFVEGMPMAKPGQGQARQPNPECADIAGMEPDPVAVAFARGEAAGREAAMEEFHAAQETVRKLRLNFRALDQAALDCLAEELAHTVVNLCARAIADYSPDAETLMERCREAAKRLGTGSGECSLHLHPDDLALLDKAAMEGWRVVSDAGVERGGLRFETPDGCVNDGPAQWRRAIAAAIRG